MGSILRGSVSKAMLLLKAYAYVKSINSGDNTTNTKQHTCIEAEETESRPLFLNS